MSEFTLHTATAADAKALRAIRLEALLDSPEAFGSTYDEVVTWPPERWVERVEQRAYVLAETEGRVVGMAAGGYHDRYPDTYWLYGMFVSARYRGAGVAEQLVSAINRWARDEGATALWLHVIDVVARARTFYRRLGFVETGEVTSLDRDPRRQVITMVRPLGHEVADLAFRVEVVDAQRLHDVRRRVLRGDDPAKVVADPRDGDALALHVAGLRGARLVVTSSYYPSVSPVHPERPAYQLRYMATEVDVQGRGYGARVAAVGEAILWGRGVREIWANGRDTALAFYRATGWSTLPGSEHRSPETGLPHTMIVKELVGRGVQ